MKRLGIVRTNGGLFRIANPREKPDFYVEVYMEEAPAPALTPPAPALTPEPVNPDPDPMNEGAGGAI